MALARQIPWPRVFVEGVVIVVSILLAFGVDAWWGERQERAGEQQALAGLESDFTVNAERLRTVITVHRAANALVRDLGRMPDAQLAGVPADSVRLYVSALRIPFTFDPQDGTLDAIISSGRLGLITDPRLREALVAWKSLVEDAEEEVAEMRRWSAEGLRLQALLGGPFQETAPGFTERQYSNANNRYTEADLRAFDVYPEADLGALAGDPELMAVARAKSYAASYYVLELGTALSHAEEVLQLITANLRH